MACVIVLPEGRADEGDEVVQAVNQATHVTEIVKQAVRLPNYDLLIHVHL